MSLMKNGFMPFLIIYNEHTFLLLIIIFKNIFIIIITTTITVGDWSSLSHDY